MSEHRLFAIGDIHGCSTALKTILDAINPAPDDTIVILGDIIDWGPDSCGCVQQLIDLSDRCKLMLIRGNHEEMLFAAAESQSELKYWMKFGGDKTLESYGYRGGDSLIDRDHKRFLMLSRDYWEIDDFIFVHANYYPGKTMIEQSNTILQWDFPDPCHMVPHCSGKTVIAGHTPQTSGEVLDLGFAVLIDTDCSRGGWLSALEVYSGEIIQARQTGETRRTRRST